MIEGTWTLTGGEQGGQKIPDGDLNLWSSIVASPKAFPVLSVNSTCTTSVARTPAGRISLLVPGS